MPALALTLLLARSVLSGPLWVTEKITNTQWYETGPKVYGETIYFNDFRSGPADVYAWTRAGGAQPVIQAPGTQVVDSVYEDRIVYRSYTQEAQGYADLYVYDPAEGSRPISTAPGDQTNADMWGDTVVWEDYRAGSTSPRVYMWDPVNGERRITACESRQENPRIWGDTIIWEDTRNGRWDVYMYNPRDGEKSLGPFAAPDIYEGRVVMWALAGPDGYGQYPGLWEWTPQGGIRWLERIYMTSYPYYMNLWGDVVVWSGNGPSNVVAWDPVHGINWVDQSGSSSQPSLYDGRVAWIGGTDLYLSTMVPEPSSLAALAASVGLLCLVRRRRG
jgi:beta propeller repeat protein